MKHNPRASLASVLIVSMLLPTFAAAKDAAKKADAKKTEATKEKTEEAAEDAKESKKAKDDEELVQNYEGGIRGLRSLMRDLKDENPKVHDALFSDYKRLNRRHNTGMAILVGGGLGGAALSVVGFLKFMKGGDEAVNGEDSDAGDEKAKKGFYLFLGGIGVSAVSFWVSQPFFPDQQDYKDFTNKHNKLNKKSQLRWNSARLMLNEEYKPMLASTWTF